MADTMEAAAAGAEAGEARASYTSVVYVHGMGSQRRYEETSRLVDRIDQLLSREYRRGNPIGMLRNIKARVEPLRSDPDKDIVGYIRTVFTTGPKMEGARAVRFYEVYWAPLMAETRSARGVLKWLFAQPLRPWRTLRAPWRERQRLRRASLVALFERGRPLPPGAEERDYSALVRLYDEFEGLEAQRRFPAGTFDDFHRFMGEEWKSRPETAQRRQRLARSWRRAYQGEEIRNAFILTTIALALLLLFGGLVVGVLAALQSLIAYKPLADVLTRVDAPFKADWKTTLTIIVSLGGLVGVGKFLTDYLGDVEAWATYEETDLKHVARGKVLDRSMEMLTHVLGDPNCERVVVVAHSLGASIAHDALLALTRRNRAHNIQAPMQGPVPLHKIEHFVTMGAPIDKIEYFFESYASASHRYKRVVEALRGDIGTEPFSNNRKPHIHWINFWDQGDAISGALHSPASGGDFCQHVDNVHVASFGFPDPAASHSAYFDHRTVVSRLFQVIYHRDGAFQTLVQPGPNLPYDYDSVYLGPGEPLGRRIAYLALAAVTPWLALAGLVAWLLDCRTVALGIWGVAGLALAAIAVGYTISRIAGQRQPI